MERAENAPTVAVPGSVYSRNDVQITAGIAGQLLVVAEPGPIVQQGEAVARLDPDPGARRVFDRTDARRPADRHALRKHVFARGGQAVPARLIRRQGVELGHAVRIAEALGVHLEGQDVVDSIAQGDDMQKVTVTDE